MTVRDDAPTADGRVPRAEGRGPSTGRATASAPGGIGNLGPGLDVLGCAVDGPRDEVTAEWCDADGVVVRDAGHPELPTDAARHSSALAASAVLRRARSLGARIDAPGIAISLVKRLPLAGGQGGSAASAVAGAVATNTLLGAPLDAQALLACCLEAEAIVAGRHLDNVAPSLLGGIVVVRSIDPIDVIPVAVPAALRIVLAHPAQRLSTAHARSVLPDMIPRGTAIHQLAQVAAIVAACHTGDLALLGRAIDDRIAEPARAPLMPGFAAAKRAALDAGALGASISGAGPTMFALVDGDGAGERVAAAVREAYAREGIESAVRVARIDEDGARVEGA
jgi:homoserine kinase